MAMRDPLRPPAGGHCPFRACSTARARTTAAAAAMIATALPSAAPPPTALRRCQPEPRREPPRCPPPRRRAAIRRAATRRTTNPPRCHGRAICSESGRYASSTAGRKYENEMCCCIQVTAARALFSNVLKSEVGPRLVAWRSAFSTLYIRDSALLNTGKSLFWDRSCTRLIHTLLRVHSRLRTAGAPDARARPRPGDTARQAIRRARSR